MNECGECRECCKVLPITDDDLIKPPNEDCKHLCEAGCSLHGSEEKPETCKTFLCLWRRDPWVGSRPEYRPDRLGILIQHLADHDLASVMALSECRPRAFAENESRIRYILNRPNYKNVELIKWQGFEVGAGRDPRLKILGDDIEVVEDRARREMTFRRRIPLEIVAC